jgi:hypothetical protein
MIETQVGAEDRLPEQAEIDVGGQEAKSYPAY